MYINVGGAASNTANNMPTALQQPLDLELAKNVFRKNLDKLSNIICNYRLSIALKLYSAGLIGEESLKNATDNSPRSDRDKGITLAIALGSTINDKPDLLKKLVEILEENQLEFNSQDITKELKKDLKQN